MSLTSEAVEAGTYRAACGVQHVGHSHHWQPWTGQSHPSVTVTVRVIRPGWRGVWHFPPSLLCIGMYYTFELGARHPVGHQTMVLVERCCGPPLNGLLAAF